MAAAEAAGVPVLLDELVERSLAIAGGTRSDSISLTVRDEPEHGDDLPMIGRTSPSGGYASGAVDSDVDAVAEGTNDAVEVHASGDADSHKCALGGEPVRQQTMRFQHHQNNNNDTSEPNVKHDSTSAARDGLELSHVSREPETAESPVPGIDDIASGDPATEGAENGDPEIGLADSGGVTNEEPNGLVENPMRADALADETGVSQMHLYSSSSRSTDKISDPQKNRRAMAPFGAIIAGIATAALIVTCLGFGFGSSSGSFYFLLAVVPFACSQTVMVLTPW